MPPRGPKGALAAVICYRNCMDQASSMTKLAGRAGLLIAVVGLISFFLGVFSFAPRSFLIAGIAIIGVSLVAFFVEELSSRR